MSQTQKEEKLKINYFTCFVAINESYIRSLCSSIRVSIPRDRKSAMVFSIWSRISDIFHSEYMNQNTAFDKNITLFLILMLWNEKFRTWIQWYEITDKCVT